jgi:hydroxylysine kinase
VSGHIETIQAPPPDFTAEDATWITWEKYGIRSMARPLGGERDLNFRITDAAPRDYVLKIWNRTQDPAAVNLQLEALAHIAGSNPDLPVPRVIGALDGTQCLLLKDSGGNPHPAAMLSWLDGVFLRQAPVLDVVKASLGRTLAMLDVALADFRHPAEERELLWDVCSAGQLRTMVGDARDAALRALLNRSLDRFEADTKPTLRTLRRQLIHNDFNPDNVLVDPGDPETVTGIIDFGDVHRAPLVAELAVACAYQLSGTGDPAADILPLVTAYHEVLALNALELGVLMGLVRARLLCTLVISTRMARLFPGNREYLLCDNPAAARKLAQLDELPDADIGGKLRRACASVREVADR